MKRKSRGDVWAAVGLLMSICGTCQQGLHRAWLFSISRSMRAFTCSSLDLVYTLAPHAPRILATIRWRPCSGGRLIGIRSRSLVEIATYVEVVWESRSSQTGDSRLCYLVQRCQPPHSSHSLGSAAWSLPPHEPPSEVHAHFNCPGSCRPKCGARLVRESVTNSLPGRWIIPNRRPPQIGTRFGTPIWHTKSSVLTSYCHWTYNGRRGIRTCDFHRVRMAL